jgi:sodium/pantothenate symporter
MITRDIYHKILNPSSDFDELPNVLTLARITSLLACVIGMVIALRFTNIIELLFWTSPLQSGVIFAPMMFGLFWKKASSTGAYASIIVGACAALVDMLGIYAWPERMLFTMAASSLALVVGSLLKPDADNAEHLAHLQGK